MISFCIVSFVLVIDIFCFNRGFYNYEYKDLEVAKDIMVSKSDLNISTDILIDYIQDKADNLDFEVEINGTSQEFFTPKDKAHMVDVQKLYLNAKTVQMIALAVLIISLILLKSDKERAFHLYNAYKQLLIFMAIIILASIFYITVDFYAFWTFFHQIIFDNDLWLLSPLESNLIKMVPEQFFNHLVLLITISYIFILVITYIVLAKIRKRVFLND